VEWWQPGERAIEDSARPMVKRSRAGLYQRGGEALRTVGGRGCGQCGALLEMRCGYAIVSYGRAAVHNQGCRLQHVLWVYKPWRRGGAPWGE